MDRMRSAVVLTCISMIGAGANVHKELAHATSLQPSSRTMYGGGALPNALLVKSLYIQA